MFLDLRRWAWSFKLTLLKMRLITSTIINYKNIKSDIRHFLISEPREQSPGRSGFLAFPKELLREGEILLSHLHL